MADLQIGNREGVAASGNQPTLLATVTADGVNTVTVDDVSKLVAGQIIDIVHKTDGTELAASRTITNITSGKVVTYDGADVAATVNHGLYPEDGYAAAGRSNINGGVSEQAGYESDHMDSIAAMRARLTAINSTEYTAARLNTMLANDMAYAIRLNDAPDTIKDV